VNLGIRVFFGDPLVVEVFDDRLNYGEDRFIHIGSSEGQVLTVAYTGREGGSRPDYFGAQGDKR
jgi:uncharacterized DUF497 family protein